LSKKVEGEVEDPGAVSTDRVSGKRLSRRRVGAVAVLLGLLVFTFAISGAAGEFAAPLLGAVAAAMLLVSTWMLLARERTAASGSGVPPWMDQLPCYLSVQDQDLRIIEVNRLFRQDFGEGVGEYCYRVYKQRNSPCPNCPVLKTFEDGKEHSSEEIVTTNDGRKRSVTVTSTPIFNRKGRVSSVIEMSSNIKEVKTLERELERSRQHLENLFDIVPCYITVQDRDFRIIESNNLFKKDFGDCTGNYCYRSYKNGTRVCQDCPVEQTFADGEVHVSEETVITRDGRQAAMIVNSMPVRDESGEITGVMEVSTNITRVKELQRQLALVGMAVSGTAHRVKNVMMGLEGGVFVVNTAFEDDDAELLKEGWEMVQRNAAKVSHIASDLLFCSRERAPKLEEGVSPKAVAREVHDLYRARAAQEGISLRLQVGDEDDSGVFDREALYNLMTNLVGNALDACRFDPRSQEKQHEIVLRSSLNREGNVLIEVEDNGSGISEKDRGKVFEGFFSSKGTEGTGLGLLVVQQVVREHGGSITFDSRESEGTLFRVVLPFRRTLEESTKAKTSSGFFRPYGGGEKAT
jgi:signal transduction histidine kinase